MSSTDSLAGELSLRRTIELIYSLISLTHSVKVFSGKWQTIRFKLNELNSGLMAADNCDLAGNLSLSDSIPPIVASINDCTSLARRCVDMSYSGKLLMQSDLNLISVRFDCHIKKLAEIYSDGILTSGSAIVVSKPSFGATREDMRFYLKDLVTRMKIGDWDMKKRALTALNEALIVEMEKYGSLLAGIDESVTHLVKFLDSSEMVIQEESAKAISLISGVDSCRRALIEVGIIAPLIRVLENGTNLGKENSARALQKLTQNSDNSWSVSSYGGVTALLKLCDSDGESAGLACGVLKNLSGVEEIKRFIIGEGAISVFIKLLKSRDESVQINSIDALQIIAHKDEETKETIFRKGAIPVLISILDPKFPSQSSSKVTEFSLRAIENLCLSNPPAIDVLLCYDFTSHLLFLIQNSEISVREQALKLTIKFCRASEEGIKAMGNDGFIPVLVNLLSSPHISEMAAEVLSCMVSVSKNRKRFVQESRNVSSVMQLLDPEQGNNIWGSIKWLLSILMEVSSCESGRRRISRCGHVKNIGKLADDGDLDAKRILKRLSRSRFRSMLNGIWKG